MRTLERDLLSKYHNRINIESSNTPDKSGLFEVQIENGRLAWSKKETNRFPVGDRDMNGIYECIDEALNINKNLIV